MLTLSPAVGVYLYTASTDMRKSIDGLAAMVKAADIADIFSGHLFVFVSKRRDRCKILVWDDGGFVLYYKRLESGRFKLPVMDATSTSVSLSSGQLVMLLGGFDTAHLQRQKLWTPRQRF